jgi:hypothetical protein
VPERGYSLYTEVSLITRETSAGRKSAKPEFGRI